MLHLRDLFASSVFFPVLVLFVSSVMLHYVVGFFFLRLLSAFSRKSATSDVKKLVVIGIRPRLGFLVDVTCISGPASRKMIRRDAVDVHAAEVLAIPKADVVSSSFAAGSISASHTTIRRWFSVSLSSYSMFSFSPLNFQATKSSSIKTFVSNGKMPIALNPDLMFFGVTVTSRYLSAMSGT